MTDIHNIHESITSLATPVDTLLPLEGNPRKGNVDAITASYEEFGQVKPIVVRPNGDGTSTVLAGNHQLQAAKRLGWTHIAAIELPVDDKRGIAFALADNRTNELGRTDDELLHTMLTQVIDEYDYLMEGMGWDDFEMAILDAHDYTTEQTHGYLAPVIQEISPVIQPVIQTNTPTAERNIDGDLQAPPETNTTQAVIQGAPSIVANGSKTIVQYTLVFDDPEQQREWYNFMRWLRNDPATDGDTTATRLLNFVSQHANY